MRAIKVYFANSEKTIETNINGTAEEIKAYYIGRWFDLGSGDNELMLQATEVEFK